MPAAGEPAARTRLRGRSDGRSFVQGRGTKVLVVVADAVLRQLIAIVLADAGYRVCVGAGGVEALAIAEGFEPGLVVLDWMTACPAIVTGELRRNRANLPMLFLVADPNARLAAELVAGSSVLEMPFYPHQLIDGISRTLATPATAGTFPV